MQTEARIIDPDGVPHEIVGLILVFAIVVAFSAFAALQLGSGLAFAVLAFVPFAIAWLNRYARRKRVAERTAA